MSNILLQYYQGITQQLRAEVDLINTLFHHQGVKGEGNEAVLRELLIQFIPKRYGVGTGVVIDRNGNQSRQCDIVIYDTFLYPSLLSLRSVHLFPVDIVYATIEVKTTLTANSVKEAKENIASVRRLNIVADSFSGTETRNGSFHFMSYNPEPPMGFVFAYNSEAKQCETYKNWFLPNNTDTLSLFPILVGCLDQGLVLWKTSEGVLGTRPEAGMELRGWIPPLLDAMNNPIEFTEARENYIQSGVVNPVKRIKNTYVTIDQSKVLVLFLLFLQEMIAHKRINPEISFLNQYFQNGEIEEHYEM